MWAGQGIDKTCGRYAFKWFLAATILRALSAIAAITRIPYSSKNLKVLSTK
jgi:hypothetical protein